MGWLKKVLHTTWGGTLDGLTGYGKSRPDYYGGMPQVQDPGGHGSDAYWTGAGSEGEAKYHGQKATHGAFDEFGFTEHMPEGGVAPFAQYEAERISAARNARLAEEAMQIGRSQVFNSQRFREGGTYALLNPMYGQMMQTKLAQRAEAPDLMYNWRLHRGRREEAKARQTQYTQLGLQLGITAAASLGGAAIMAGAAGAGALSTGAMLGMAGINAAGNIGAAYAGSAGQGDIGYNTQAAGLGEVGGLPQQNPYYDSPSPASARTQDQGYIPGMNATMPDPAMQQQGVGNSPQLMGAGIGGASGAGAPSGGGAQAPSSAGGPNEMAGGGMPMQGPMANAAMNGPGSVNPIGGMSFSGPGMAENFYRGTGIQHEIAAGILANMVMEGSDYIDERLWALRSLMA